MMYNAKALIALGLAAMAVSPLAAGEAPMPTRSVSYAGLDLTQPQHAAELERRVSRAVRQVCRQAYGGSVAMSQAQCRNDTSKAAFAAIDRAVALAEARRATQLAAR